MTVKALSERSIHVLSGLAAMILGLAAVTFGVEVANGALKAKYQLTATFTAAGQGLQSRSDVKIHGVNIGRVKSVRLVDGKAQVRMDIDAGQHVPVDAKATIRPKTLFGEKFVDVDPGDHETSGPFLRDEGQIKDTLGGFELEQVLADAYPILKAIKPEDLVVVLDELAKAGAGEGPAIARQIDNFQKLGDIQVAHNADTDQFLRDLASLSATLDQHAGDIVAGAHDLNDALPTLNQRGDKVATTLEQTARLSADLADLLEANQPFLVKGVTEGSKVLQIVVDRQGQIGPLVLGLRHYLELQAEVARIPFGDGTVLAAIKFVIGEDCPTARAQNGCLSPGGGLPVTPPPLGAPSAAPGAGSGSPGGLLGTGVPVPVTPVPPLSGAGAISALLQGLRR
jgi:phospholipid/cholesterol/gamma-HCH transport system substrate-binding protein